MTTPPKADPAALPRVLSFWDGVAIAVGMSIGAGIFMTAPGVAALFTSPGPVLLLWITAAVVSVTVALTYAELGAAVPHTGGYLAFILEGYGRPTAFVAGWQHILLQPASVGALALAFADFFLDFVAAEGALTPEVFLWARSGLAIGVLALLTGVAVIGTREAAWVAKIFTTLKVLALVALIGGGLLLIDFQPARFANLTTFEAHDGALSAALVVGFFSVIWTYGGYDAVTQVGGEIVDAPRNIPRVLVTAVIVIAVIYLLINFVYLNALGNDGLAASKNVAADVGTLMAGPGFGKLITFMIVCSVFGTVNGAVLCGARMVFLLARTGLSFEILGRTHPRHETPHMALYWNLAASTFFILLWPSFFDLLGYAIFAATPFIALAAAAVFVLRRRGVKSPYPVPGYPFVPLAAVGFNALVLVYAFVGDLTVGLGITAVLALGYPVFLVWERLRTR